jgi:hypothetical protein
MNQNILILKNLIYTVYVCPQMLHCYTQLFYLISICQTTFVISIMNKKMSLFSSCIKQRINFLITSI